MIYNFAFDRKICKLQCITSCRTIKELETLVGIGCTREPQGLFCFMTYSEKLKDPRWQKKRLIVLSRDKFTCRYCRDKESTLHVHHMEYNGDPWTTSSKKLITLCEHCHCFVEWVKKVDNEVLDQSNIAVYGTGTKTRLYVVRDKDRVYFAVMENKNPYYVPFSFSETFLNSLLSFLNPKENG